MTRLRKLVFSLAVVLAGLLVVTYLRPGVRGPDTAVAPVLLLSRLRLNCKVPVLF
jgi:hypothetical protein